MIQGHLYTIFAPLPRTQEQHATVKSSLDFMADRISFGVIFILSNPC